MSTLIIIHSQQKHISHIDFNEKSEKQYDDDDKHFIIIESLMSYHKMISIVFLLTRIWELYCFVWWSCHHNIISDRSCIFSERFSRSLDTSIDDWSEIHIIVRFNQIGSVRYQWTRRLIWRPSASSWYTFYQSITSWGAMRFCACFFCAIWQTLRQGRHDRCTDSIDTLSSTMWLRSYRFLCSLGPFVTLIPKFVSMKVAQMKMHCRSKKYMCHLSFIRLRKIRSVNICLLMVFILWLFVDYQVTESDFWSFFRQILILASIWWMSFKIILQSKEITSVSILRLCNSYQNKTDEKRFFSWYSSQYRL